MSVYVQCVFASVSELFTSERPGANIGCLHGIRALTTVFIIAGHVVHWLIPCTENYTLTGEAILSDWRWYPLVYFDKTVDTMFFLSGFLLCHHYLNNKQLNWCSLLASRYLRLTPCFLATIVMYMYMYPDVARMCKPHGWMFLLYIANFKDGLLSKCFCWTWSLAVDMQFYVLSPLLLMCLRWNARYFVFTAVMVLSCLASAIISSKYDLPVAVIMDFEKPQNAEFFNRYVDMPWCRINAFLIGIITRHVLSTRTWKLSSKQIVMGWVVAVFVCICALYGIYPGKDSTFGNSVYNSLSRTLWSLGVALVVILCSTGHSDAINRFLSSSPFVILSKISYCTLLLHWIVLHVVIGGMQHKIHFTGHVYMQTLIRCACMSFGLGAIMHVALEKPCQKFQNHVREHLKKKKLE